MKKVYFSNFSKKEIFEDNKPIKLRKDEVFVTFMKFKRRLFVMTTQRIYEIVENKEKKYGLRK